METVSTQSDVAVLTSDRPGNVVADYEQPRFSQRETLLTMFGVLMVMLLASLDQTRTWKFITFLPRHTHGILKNEFIPALSVVSLSNPTCSDSLVHGEHTSQRACEIGLLACCTGSVLDIY
jgi:hypothetical protein